MSKVVSLPLEKARPAARSIEAEVSGAVVMLSPESVELEPEPIPRDWIVSGSPEARCKKVVRSRDRTSHIVIWECTPGSFTWYYGMDEAIVIVAGEAFMINDRGEERRFGPGDLGFFPAGTSCTWRITQTLRKVGVLRRACGVPWDWV